MLFLSSFECWQRVWFVAKRVLSVTKICKTHHAEPMPRSNTNTHGTLLNQVENQPNYKLKPRYNSHLMKEYIILHILMFCL